MTVKILLDTVRDYLSLREEDEIRDTFDRFDWKLNERNLVPHTFPVTRFLPDLPTLAKPGERRLIEQLIALASELRWGQTYDAGDFGAEFLQNYGWVELLGTRGHFDCSEIAIGFVMFGTWTHYPNHHHVAEEIYIPLTSGSQWSCDDGEFLPRKSGEFIYHPSNMPHSMKMHDQPMLALYVWRNGDLAQKSDY